MIFPRETWYGVFISVDLNSNNMVTTTIIMFSPICEDGLIVPYGSKSLLRRYLTPKSYPKSQQLHLDSQGLCPYSFPLLFGFYHHAISQVCFPCCLVIYLHAPLPLYPLMPVIHPQNNLIRRIKSPFVFHVSPCCFNIQLYGNNTWYACSRTIPNMETSNTRGYPQKA